MFENLEENKEQSPAASGAPKPLNGIQPRPPLAPNNFPPAGKAEDIFAGLKDIGAPAAKKESPVFKSSADNGGQGLRILIIIIIVLFFVVIGLFLASRYLSAGESGQLDFSRLKFWEKKEGTEIIKNEEVKKENPAVENKEIVPEEIPAVEEKKEAATTTENNLVSPDTPIIAADADSDGLSDAREGELGTNPLKSDTDNDELTDSEEVNVWKTDPLNPDTDGDTYLDGKEVKAGYDPLRALKKIGEN